MTEEDTTTEFYFKGNVCRYDGPPCGRGESFIMPGELIYVTEGNVDDPDLEIMIVPAHMAYTGQPSYCDPRDLTLIHP